MNVMGILTRCIRMVLLKFINQHEVKKKKKGNKTMKEYSIDVVKKRCVTPECRGSYVNILEPRPLPQSNVMAWGMQCIFEKTPVIEQWVSELKSVYAQVLIDKFGKEKASAIAQIIAAKKTFPIRNGDDLGDVGALANADQLKGCYFLNTNNRFRRPHVIGPMGKAVAPEDLSPDDIYSGAYYRVMLEFWYYDTAGNKGISTSIAAVMKTKDGENLGAGTSSTEASNALSEYAGEAASLFTADTEKEDTESLGSESEEKKPDEPFTFM